MKLSIKQRLGGLLVVPAIGTVVALGLAYLLWAHSRSQDRLTELIGEQDALLHRALVSSDKLVHHGDRRASKAVLEASRGFDRLLDVVQYGGTARNGVRIEPATPQLAQQVAELRRRWARFRSALLTMVRRFGSDHQAASAAYDEAMGSVDSVSEAVQRLLGAHMERSARLDGQMLTALFGAAGSGLVALLLGIRLVTRHAVGREDAEERFQLFQSIVESSHEAIAVSDANGRLLYINPAHERLFGRGLAQARGLSYRDCYPADSVEKLETELVPALKRGEGWEGEMDALDAAGNRFPLWARADAVMGKGRLKYGIAIMRNVAAEHQARARLRASEARYRGVVESQRDLIVRVDADGRFTFVNQPYCRMFGKSASELLGRRFEPFVSADQLHIPQQALEDLRHPPYRVQVEHQVPAADGARWLTWEASAIFDAAGDIEEIQGIGRDITARKHMEDALRNSEAHLRQIIDLVPHMIFAKDRDGRFLLVNQAVAQAYGRSVDELVNLTHADVHSDSQELRKMLADDREVIDTGTPKMIPEETFVDAESKRSVLQTVKIPYRVAGRDAEAVLGVAIDITQRKQAEQALQESEAKYRAVMENASDAIFIADLNGRFIDANRRAEDLLDRTKEEILSLSAADIHPADDPNVVAAFRDITEKGASLYEHLVVRRDGSTVPVEVAGTLIEYHGRKVALGTFRDNRERKRAEEALRESEERFRTLVEASSDWIWATDEHARYTYASPRVRDLLGYEPKEVLGATPFDLMPPEEAERLRCQFETICARRAPIVRLENINRRKDGTLVVLETNGVPVCDGEGAFRGYRGVDRDITESKRALKALRESEEMLRELADNIEEVFFVRDLEQTRMIYVSAAYERIWGRPVSAIYENRWDFMESVHPDDKARITEAAQAQKHGRFFDQEYRIVRPDGQVRWVRARTFPICNDSGEVYRIAGLAEDITERKQAEQQRLADEAAHRETLVREVHHRIKNHLQGLIGLLRQHAREHPDVTKPLQIVMGQIHSVALVHGLQGKSGHGEIQLCEMIESIVRSTEGITGRAILPRLESSVRRPMRVSSDHAVPLALIVNELIVNALKHSDLEAEEAVHLRLEELSDDRARLVIDNSGRDLPADFDLEAGRGIGTGLKLVRALLPGQGGRLTLVNHHGGVRACLELSPPLLRGAPDKGG